MICMIPRRAIEGSTDLSAATTFWIPKPSDIDEESFGYFRGTGTSLPESLARCGYPTRAEIAEVVDGMAGTDAEFERLHRSCQDVPSPAATRAIESRSITTDFSVHNIACRDSFARGAAASAAVAAHPHVQDRRSPAQRKMGKLA